VSTRAGARLTAARDDWYNRAVRQLHRFAPALVVTAILLLPAIGSATPTATSQTSTAAACSSVPVAQRSARTRLVTLFAAIARQHPATARSVFALHRRNPGGYRSTFVLWHSRLGEHASHIEVAFRSHRGSDRTFDTWVQQRPRRFAVQLLQGDAVHAGTIELSVAADLTQGASVLNYTGKAEFDCLQNRYVFLQLGRVT
jgi:hypothetical protein